MPKDFNRTRRIGEQIQRELAVLIQRELKDPRVGMVTVSGVEVTKDLSQAKVYITLLDDQRNVKEVLQALDHAAGFMRHELGQRLIIRSMPALKFYYDNSIRHGSEMSHLIDVAISSDQDKQKD